MKKNILKLTEDKKRFYQRNLTKKENYSLNQVDKNGGTMPEDLPTPKKSLKELAKEEIKKLKENN